MSRPPPRLDPRGWVGRAPFPWPAAASLGAGDLLVGCYAVIAVQMLKTRQDKPYLRVQLTDSHGRLEARVWDDAEAIADALDTGSYVGVRGRIEIFNGERQLKVEAIEALDVPPEELRWFLPRSDRPAEVMEAELRALLDSLQDEPLRALLDRIIGESSDTGRAYRIAPAAKYNHHACIGGLLEHSLSVATVCSMLAAHYGAALDRDLVVAAALIHDIGKIREIGAQPGFPYTDEGKLLGHILIGLQIVRDAARQVPALEPKRLLLLEHLVASHQGRHEWQSPREPRTLEAIVLHYADDLDAKIEQVSNLIEATPRGWTAYDRGLQREFLRHIEPAQRREDDTAATVAPALPSHAGNPATPTGAAGDARDRTANAGATAAPAHTPPGSAADVRAISDDRFAGEPDPVEPDAGELEGDVASLLDATDPDAAAPIVNVAAPSRHEDDAGRQPAAGEGAADLDESRGRPPARLADESLDLFGD